MRRWVLRGILLGLRKIIDIARGQYYKDKLELLRMCDLVVQRMQQHRDELPPEMREQLAHLEELQAGARREFRDELARDREEMREMDARLDRLDRTKDRDGDAGAAEGEVIFTWKP